MSSAHLPHHLSTRSSEGSAKDSTPPGVKQPAAVSQVTLRTAEASYLAIGTRLADGRYEIVEKLGEGGFGVVYRALEKGEAICRWVAVKVAHLESGCLETQGQDLPVKSATMARFQAEAHLIGQLQHPNIISIFYDGVHLARRFFVMEYLPGSQSLAAILRAAQLAQAPVPLARVRAYFLAAGAGLRAIHRLPGVLHRDIKLENILACDTPEGPVVKIVDFGVAHNPCLALTQTGCLLGTPGYQAPESILCDDKTGKPVSLDARADLFALGVALYRFVTFAQAFETPQQALAQNIRPRPPSHVRPIPKSLECIILRLLEKDRTARYPNCDAFLADLTSFNPQAPVCTPQLSASVLDGELPSIALSKLDMAGAHDAASVSRPAPIIGLEALEQAVAQPSFSLKKSAAAYAAALKQRPAAPRRSIAPRDRALIAGVGLLCLVLALSVGHGRRQRQKSLEPLPPRGEVSPPQLAVSAQDILRDAHKNRREFVARLPIAATADTASPVLLASGRGTSGSLPSAHRKTSRRTKPAPVPHNTEFAYESEQASVSSTNLLARYESSIPAMQLGGPVLAETSGSNRRQLGIPTATTVAAVLLNTVSSSRPGTLAVARLTKGITVQGRQVVAPGAQLVGTARFQERSGQWYVNLDFDRLVMPHTTEEWRIAAMATQAGEAGLLGHVARVDKRNEANAGKAILGAVQDIIRGVPGQHAASPFLRDQDTDLQALRRQSLTVQLPRHSAFQAQFTQPS